MLGSASAWALSYSAVILFLKNSKRCENIPQRHRQSDGQTTYNLVAALCVVSRGNKYTVLVQLNLSLIHI